MKKYRIGVVGFFGNGVSTAGGQEAKTCALTRAFKETYGEELVATVDTLNWKRQPFKLLRKLVAMASNSKNIFMLPAQNSVRIFVPLFVFLRLFYKCRLHYAVVGGWLPEMTGKHKVMAFFAKKLDGIYVETGTMKLALEEQGFTNVTVLPNFKYITPLNAEDLITQYSRPYRLCTFSRVMKEKGIEDAIEAVAFVNKEHGETVLELDIYGKIDPGYEERFEKIMAEMPAYIRYCGLVEPEQSVDVLKNYFALLFPTYYEGEGFAGTLLDAYASGVPVIASDWKYNPEIVNENVGYVYPTKDHAALVAILKEVVSDPTLMLNRKRLCLIEADKYRIDKVVQVIVEQIERD